MTDKDTLLSFIARHHAIGLEDVATDALRFILSRSTSARRALSEALGDDCGPLPIAKAETRTADAHGAIPDLACFDADDNLVALIESKFWASLTHHQPVTYWQGLPIDRPSVLLFLAPASRVADDSLWDELEGKLRAAGHELGPVRKSEGRITAHAKCGQRRLMLTSWTSLLATMAQRARDDGDAQACFEIAELQGLAASVVAGDRPTRDENLKQLIRDAVAHLKQSKWAVTNGLTVGQGFGYHGRYLFIAGAYAWLGIDYEAAKQTQESSLWLSFSGENAGVGLEAVRSRLAGLTDTNVPWLGGACLPIVLPAAADRQTTLNAIVAELERIARIIDPDGPTYRKTRSSSA